MDSNKIKKGLGRGLSSLIGETKVNIQKNKISISDVKGLFQTGDRPTQENYVDLIDTLSSQSTDLGSSGNNENTINGIENVTVIDNFDATVWRMVKYIVSISKTSSLLGDKF